MLYSKRCVHYCCGPAKRLRWRAAESTSRNARPSFSMSLARIGASAGKSRTRWRRIRCAARLDAEGRWTRYSAPVKAMVGGAGRQILQSGARHYYELSPPPALLDNPPPNPTSYPLPFGKTRGARPGTRVPRPGLPSPKPRRGLGPPGSRSSNPPHPHPLST